MQAYRQASFLTTCDPETFSAAVDESLNQVLKRISTLPFWRDRLTELHEPSGRAMLERLPILTREDLQEKPERLRVPVIGASEEHYSTSQTSGSTGKPVQVLKYRPVQAVQSGVMSLMIRDWAQVDISQNYARLRSSTEETVSDTWGFPYELIGKTGSSVLFDINVRKASGILDAIEAQDIGYVHGNITILRAVALEAKAASRLPKSLKKAFSWAERVFQEDRDFIRDALGIEIWDIYSSEELGVIALQCRYEQHLHVLPFRSIVEIVDEDGKTCEIGQTGRILVTTLRNPVQPLIRYELGDLARFAPHCKHFPNLPVIEPEITRTRDSYKTRSGEIVFPRFGAASFLGFGSLRDYQISMYSNAIVFHYASSEPLSPAQEEDIEREVSSQFARDFPVLLVRVEQGELFSHWKRQTFYRFDEPYLEGMTGR